MGDPVVSSRYPNSAEPIRLGDRVSIDGHFATVTGVYLPGSPEAEGCNCEETGTLAVLFDDGVPVLIPFGNHTEVIRG
jgi:hypothetical protein